MEPRVYNLLEKLPSDRHAFDHHTVSNSSGAVYPTSTLPAIRPLHEDHAFDSRPYDNDINSLTLPEIDWQALTNNIHHHPPASNATTSSHVISQEQRSGTQSKRPTKSGAPLAEVLNQASPEIRNAQRPEEFPEPETRKRRRLEGPGAVTRTLPRPAPAAKKGNKRQPFLPPLLVPLHEPPPDARLIPSMTNLGFRERMDKIPSREALRGEQRATSPPPQPTPPASAESQEKTDEQKNAQAAKNRRARHNWSEEETSHLLRGVAKFGIGSWKKILDHSEYRFRNRTAVDLKDRFRTCCPDEYRKAGTEKTQAEESTPIPAVKKPRPKPPSRLRDPENSTKFEHKLPDELARLGISGPFPKAQRRARRGFSAEEDEAILRGFEKYGAKWTKIQSDHSLGLSSRSRTDLRDRFRNKFPEKFIETGHKFKLKEGEPSKDSNETEKAGTDTPSDQPPSASAPHSATLPTSTLSESHAPQYSLRLLTAPIPDSSYFTEFGDLTPDDEDHGTITLSRNIFDWADQNSRAAVASGAAAPTRAEISASQMDLSATITTMDQFHMNPMLALKVPHPPTSGAQNRDGAIAAPSNLFPQLPLSGILNGPVSLPPPAELVSGVEADGRIES